MNPRFATLLLIVVSTIYVGGCSKPTPPAVTAPKTTYSQGIEQLKTHCDAIKAAFDAGTPRDSDTAMHDAFHLLNELPKFEGIAAMSAEDQASVGQGCKDLLAALTQIHDSFHGEGDVGTDGYEAVADQISAGLELLSSKVPAGS